MKLSCVFSAAAAGVAAIFLMGASSCEEALANPDKFFNEEVDQTPSYVVSIHDMIKYQRGEGAGILFRGYGMREQEFLPAFTRYHENRYGPAEERPGIL